MLRNRLNLPENYIKYVKSWPKFQNGVLDNFPKCGIILYDTGLKVHLAGLGIDEKHITAIKIGTSMPGTIFIIAASTKNPPFFIAEGLPGGSGMATLSAELFSLGAETIVHVGLCGLLGDTPPSGQAILASGAHKDSVARILSKSENSDELALPSKTLNSKLAATFHKNKQPLHRAYGYTTPLFYFQPAELIEGLVSGISRPQGKAMSYIEMEQASLFQTAEIMGKQAASIVIGSDRYRMESGNLVHNFETDFDQDVLELIVLKLIIRAFK